MASPGLVSGEHYDHKLAALFASASDAASAARWVKESIGLSNGQVRLLAPGDPAPGRVLEPEVAGIERTLIRSHLVMGACGGVAGLAAFAVLYLVGVPLVTASPMLAVVALLFFGTLAGLLIGGLISLRPDHDPYVHRVLSGLRAGRAAVVVHARSDDELEQAKTLLAARGGETVSSF